MLIIIAVIVLILLMMCFIYIYIYIYIYVIIYVLYRDIYTCLTTKTNSDLYTNTHTESILSSKQHKSAAGATGAQMTRSAE